MLEKLTSQILAATRARLEEGGSSGRSTVRRNQSRAEEQDNKTVQEFSSSSREFELSFLVLKPNRQIQATLGAVRAPAICIH